MPPQVTFTIPVFNGGSFLGNAIKSVFEQTIPDWQLVLIDDASTDGSTELIRSITAGNIIRLYNETNSGLYFSLNRAIDRVTTEWCVILHQDDELRANYLEELLGLVKRYPHADAVWAEQDIIGSAGDIVTKRIDTAKVIPIGPGKQPWISALERGCYWIGTGSMTRTRLLKANRFRTDLPHCADYEWFLRTIRSAAFLYYQKPLVRVRQHPSQASALNLATGRDIREYCCVIEENVSRHAGDLTTRAALAISRNWLQVIGRRAAVATLRGRWRYAAWLAAMAARFVVLPLHVGLAPRVSG